MNRETIRTTDRPETNDADPAQGELFRLAGGQFITDREQLPPIPGKRSVPAGRVWEEGLLRIDGTLPRGRRSESSAYERRIERLRRSTCYQEHLGALDFQVADVESDREVGDILIAYGDSFAGSRTPARDRSVLRLELRQFVGWCYNVLHHEINQKFPGSYSYKHSRHDLYATDGERGMLTQRDEVRPLDYYDQSARLIVDSVMVDALFGATSSQLKRAILQRNSSSHRPVFKSWRELDAINLNDYLPNEFLIGRFWMLQRLLCQLDGCDRLEDVVRRTETLGYAARHSLKSLEYGDGQTAYDRLKSPCHTQPLSKDIKKLLDWQKKEAEAA